MTIQLVVFELDKKEYGIDVSAVNGILRARKFEVQTLPGTDKINRRYDKFTGKSELYFQLKY